MSTSAATTTTSSKNNNSEPSPQEGDVMFGKFIIPEASVFYRSPLSSYAFVNLRPLVPGHVLVIPHDRVATMAELSEEAYLDMWKTVRVVQSMLKQHYKDTTAFNVAIQDGRAAGQSVPHVHVHILPRQDGDYERNDDIYTDLETWAPREELKVETKLQVPEDNERRDRTRQEMADEAAVYRAILEEEKTS